MLLHSVIALVALPIALAAPAGLQFQQNSPSFVSMLDSAIQQIAEPQHGIVDFSKYTVRPITNYSPISLLIPFALIGRLTKFSTRL